MVGFNPIFGCYRPENNSYANTIRTWSNINCGLASGVSFLEQKNQGVNTWDALTNLSINLGNGIMRNEVAYEMQRFGNPLGNYVNSFAGYGTPQANITGTLGLMSSFSPWMTFNSPFCSYMMGPMSMGPYCGMNSGLGFWC
ncbi:hypothetical protein HDR58_07965 [bacterium]|nr:hypothetical protein [bacterium]